MAAALAGLAVAFGAFGAHMLDDVLSAADHTTFQTGVRYQFWHALAALMICLAGPRSIAARNAAVLMLAGGVLFAGSLYLLVLVEARWAGPITPIGGAAMIAGWIVLAYALATPVADRQSSVASSTSNSNDTLG